MPKPTMSPVRTKSEAVSTPGVTRKRKLVVLLLLALMGALIVPAVTPSQRCAGTVDSRGRGPLCAVDGMLIDTAGKQVHLVGINWFGFETESFAPHRLYART